MAWEQRLAVMGIDGSKHADTRGRKQAGGIYIYILYTYIFLGGFNISMYNCTYIYLRNM